MLYKSYRNWLNQFSRNRGIVYSANYTPTLVILVPNDVQDVKFRVDPGVVTTKFVDLGLNFEFYNM